MKDFASQAPQAICEVTATNVNRTMIINSSAPPFNNPDLRRAMALSLDRKAFIDIITDGQGDIGGAMLPPPEGVWGMPPKLLQKLPALRNPTVAPLAQPGWVAIETVIEEKVVREIIPELKDLGAEGIIEYPLNKVVY